VTKLDWEGVWFISEFCVWGWLLYVAATFTEYTSLRDVLGGAAIFFSTLLYCRLERRANELQAQIQRERERE
jgi:hypothetical protein